MNRFYALIFLMTLAQLSFGQAEFKPGFIITNHLDTIWGQGNISINQDYCLFQPYNKNEYIKYLADELFGFRILNGRYYVSKELVTFEYKGGFFVKDTIIEKNIWYFLEYLIDGEVDLFVLRESVSNRYFIEKENHPIRELFYDKKEIVYKDDKKYLKEDKSYLGILKAYMKDSPEIFDKIDNFDKVEQKSLIKLVEEYHYNVCKDKDCINYAKSIPKVNIKIEPFVGLNYHNNFYTSQYGVFFNFWRPLKNEKLYFKIGLAYTSLPFFSSSDSIQNPKPKKTITIPFYWQYIYGNKKFKPSIGIGFINGNFLSSLQGGFNYTLNDNTEISFNSSIDGLLATLSNTQKEVFNNNIGHSFKIGLLVKIK